MVAWLHEFIWGPGMLFLFLFVGVIYTVKLKGFPVLGMVYEDEIIFKESGN